MTKMPEPVMHGSTGNFTMGELVLNHREPFHERYPGFWPEDAQWLLGFILPPFQRPPVWSVEQSTRFIESAWLGFHLGHYVVNETNRARRPGSTDLWLIDGQQRLRAIKAYLDDEFPVLGHRWSDLDSLEQWAFKNTAFARTSIRESDEAKLRDLYNRLNFGGVAHTEDQRA